VAAVVDETSTLYDSPKLHSDHPAWSGSSAWFDSSGGHISNLLRLAALLAFGISFSDSTFRNVQKSVKKLRKAVKRMVGNMQVRLGMLVASGWYLTWARQDDHR
jgi:hypothetical protein